MEANTNKCKPSPFFKACNIILIEIPVQEIQKMKKQKDNSPESSDFS